MEYGLFEDGSYMLMIEARLPMNGDEVDTEGLRAILHRMDRDNSDEEEIIAYAVEHKEVFVVFDVIEDNTGVKGQACARIHAGFVPRFETDE